MNSTPTHASTRLFAALSPALISLRTIDWLALAAVLLVAGSMTSQSATAQSTKASLIGVVHDSSGAVVPGAAVSITGSLTAVSASAQSDGSGTFQFVDLEPATYVVKVSHAGFATTEEQDITLAARQQLRLEILLQLSNVQQEVTVSAAGSGALNTEDSSIADALSATDLVSLPANYRGNGSTSPLNVIQTLPGIQPDSASFPPGPSASPYPAVKFSVQGGLPSQSETTVDGISAQNQTNNEVQADAFPSAESISEIRVDGVNNNAEYGQPGEITTVTKHGTDQIHGSGFWYFQNAAFDAVPYGSPTKPHKVANDFGGSVGGPVVIPHLYDGKGRSFFFGTYEGLRFPLTTPQQFLVPTTLEKKGDFSQETTTLTNPFTGGVYANEQVPINASSAPFLPLFPDPNYGITSSVAGALAAGQSYNYTRLSRNDIDSNQFDRTRRPVLRQQGFPVRPLYLEEHWPDSATVPVDPEFDGAGALPHSGGLVQLHLHTAHLE